MPEEKKRKKRVRTAPFPLPPEKLEQVRAARAQRGEPLPTTFVEDERHFVLQIGRQATLAYSGVQASWEWYDSTWTVAECLETVERRLSHGQFTVSAEWKGERIGYGRYLKREDQGLAIETIETSGAMVGLLEAAIEQAEQKRLREEEARRTVPCDYPGCDKRVLAATEMARLVQVEVDGQAYRVTFYGCDRHQVKLKLATGLSLALRGTAGSSPVHVIDLSQDEGKAVERDGSR